MDVLEYESLDTAGLVAACDRTVEQLQRGDAAVYARTQFKDILAQTEQSRRKPTKAARRSGRSRT